jgi:methylated-DNA-[protein]-cysteine S-methyltransferase
MDASYLTVVSSPLGQIWVCATESGLCGLGFGSRVSDVMLRHLARHQIASPELVTTPVLQAAVAQLETYFDRALRDFDVPLDLRGTPFQRAVWDELLEIPYGDTLTYGEVAMEVNRPRAFQAVGRAVGANPVAIIVPCHRVVGQGGSLTGYAFGVDRKAALLVLEHDGLQLRAL